MRACPPSLAGLGIAMLVACGRPAVTSPPPSTPASAQRSPEPERGGPPRYKPSSSSPEPIAITLDAYGAYGPASSAPHLGDTLADFELPLVDGGTFSLRRARAAGPVVVMFYRGFW